MKVGIAVTTYRNPKRLRGLLENMKWSGLPDIDLTVFEDPSPYNDRLDVTMSNGLVCHEHGVKFVTAPEWGCMQGIIDFAMRSMDYDWVIYVPDDVRFIRGGLWNELAGIHNFGRDWVGGIQAPYWNATDLVSMGVLPHREAMWAPESLSCIPRNPHWDLHGIPRKYINLNGAGFSISHELYRAMGGFPQCTWRLDEWAGYQAWKHGMVCLTLPGPPRIHYFGGSTGLQPGNNRYDTIEKWKEATGGLDPSETHNATVSIMKQLPDEDFDSMLKWFNTGHVLNV